MDTKNEQTKARIRAAIAEAGMSQNAFAEKVGMTRSTLSNLIKPNGPRVVNMVDLSRIAKALGKPVEAFTYDQDAELSPDPVPIRVHAFRAPPPPAEDMTIEEQALLMIVRNSGMPIGEVIKRVIGFTSGPVRPVATDETQGRLGYKPGEGA